MREFPPWGRGLTRPDGLQLLFSPELPYLDHDPDPCSPTFPIPFLPAPYAVGAPFPLPASKNSPLLPPSSLKLVPPATPPQSSSGWLPPAPPPPGGSGWLPPALPPQNSSGWPQGSSGWIPFTPPSPPPYPGPFHYGPGQFGPDYAYFNTNQHAPSNTLPSRGQAVDFDSQITLSDGSTVVLLAGNPIPWDATSITPIEFLSSLPRWTPWSVGQFSDEADLPPGCPSCAAAMRISAGPAGPFGMRGPGDRMAPIAMPGLPGCPPGLTWDPEYGCISLQMAEQLGPFPAACCLPGDERRDCVRPCSRYEWRHSTPLYIPATTDPNASPSKAWAPPGFLPFTPEQQALPMTYRSIIDPAIPTIPPPPGAYAIAPLVRNAYVSQPPPYCR